MGYFCEHSYFCGRCKPDKCTSQAQCTDCMTGWSGAICTEKICDPIKMCGDHGISKFTQVPVSKEKTSENVLAIKDLTDLIVQKEFVQALTGVVEKVYKSTNKESV